MPKDRKILLLGDEAIARGALDAGLGGVYAYPGTPSTEITEYIQAQGRGVFCRWCTNEKTAMEAALGMSYAGKRAMVCMKHVGMNVCADAFVNAGITGVNGGLVVIAADDPSMHSSQNEQDSRFYGAFAMIPVLEPSTQQECYDIMPYAFSLSESLHLPVLLRMVTRLAHSRAGVAVCEDPAGMLALEPANDPSKWVLLPAMARRQYARLIEKQKDIVSSSASSPFCPVEAGTAPKGVIACGITRNYVFESLASCPGFKPSVLKVSQYPLDEKVIRSFAARCPEGVLVCEDGQPFAEEKIKGILGPDYAVHGRLDGFLPRCGELSPDSVEAGLKAFASGVAPAPRDAAVSSCELVRPRPPQLCTGCGHRDVYEALGRVMSEYPSGRVFGDIGCYTLGALPPYKALASCVDMGASITMAKGAADAGLFPAVAVIGDSTFTHSGMTGLLDAVNSGSPITVILSDNLTTAMTGGQDSAGTSRFEAICVALGVEKEHVRVVVPIPANMDEITRILREEIEYKGVSVIIPRRECLQTLKRHKK